MKYDKIINESLKELEKEERTLFRESSLETFDMLEKNIKNRMNNFEAKILSSGKKKGKYSTVVSILVPREDYYLYEMKFSPMLDEDIEEINPNFLKSEEEFFLKKILLDIGTEEISKYDKMIFNGTIMVGEIKVDVPFKLEQDIEYKEKLKELYDVFCLNNVGWRTCNIPYINKVFKVVLTEYPVALKNMVFSEQEEIKVEIEIKELEKKIIKNHIILWNIKKNVLVGAGDIHPTRNRIHSEHYMTFDDVQSMYLCPEEQCHIYNVEERNDTVVIITDSSKKIKWRFLKIHEIDTITLSSLKYPVFENKMNENFLNKLRKESWSRLRNIGEVKRLIYSFESVVERLELEKIELDLKFSEKILTKELNGFIEDEFSLKGRKNNMILYFKLKKSDIYSYDTLNFILSELQLYFAEYNCIGILV
jgi:hypothetical protein